MFQKASLEWAKIAITNFILFLRATIHNIWFIPEYRLRKECLSSWWHIDPVVFGEKFYPLPWPRCWNISLNYSFFTFLFSVKAIWTRFSGRNILGREYHCMHTKAVFFSTSPESKSHSWALNMHKPVCLLNSFLRQSGSWLRNCSRFSSESGSRCSRGNSSLWLSKSLHFFCDKKLLRYKPQQAEKCFSPNLTKMLSLSAPQAHGQEPRISRSNSRSWFAGSSATPCEHESDTRIVPQESESASIIGIKIEWGKEDDRIRARITLDAGFSCEAQ